MNCGEIQDRLPDRAAGRLGAEALAEVDGHLTTCSECREVYEAVRSLEMTRPDVPAGLEARIVAAVRSAMAEDTAGPSLEGGVPASFDTSARPGAGPGSQEGAKGFPAPRSRWRLTPAWGLAAAAVLALAIGLPVISPADPDPDTEVGALALAEERVGEVWLDDDLMIAGAPAVSELSDEALLTLLEELER
jgi:anti-sigma factor RsiW